MLLVFYCFVHELPSLPHQSPSLEFPIPPFSHTAPVSPPCSRSFAFCDFPGVIVCVQQLLETLLAALGGLSFFFQLSATSNLGCFENVKSWFQKAARAMGVKGCPRHDTKRVSDDVLETFQTCSNQIETETARWSTGPPGDATEKDKLIEMFGLAYVEAVRVVCSPNETPDPSRIPIPCKEEPPWQKETDLLTGEEVSWSIVAKEP